VTFGGSDVKFVLRPGVLHDFDYSALDDPEFKEDSVREEIIAPILKRLGYSASPPHRIIRSRKLIHPFVSIGSASKKIHIVPDYLMEVEGRLAWTLEAKAPTESILNTKHVEQAYSYAIHSEIRVQYFALCNGRQFVLYHISKPEPVLDFDIRLLANYWENLSKLLSPSTVFDYDIDFKKDFGLHLKRLGFHEFSSLVFPLVPVRFIAQINDNLYMTSCGLNMPEGETYIVTFDFERSVLEQLRGKIPDKALSILSEPFKDSIWNVQFADATYFITVDCRVGEKLEENDREIFLPLWVNRIIG
jgi:Type I restriction enzyme R protein N terminus (HSDR_N)